MQVINIIMGLATYLAPLVLLIWGWIRWVEQPKLRTVLSILSLTGFILATASALLAASSIGYAQVHHFPYYDPFLLRIFAWGALLSLGSFVFGIGGVWRQSSLRWHAPASGACMLVFWIMIASAE